MDLVSLINTIVDDAQDMGHSVKFSSNVRRAAFLGRPIAIKRALTNLINNANRYSNHVEVNLTQRGSSIMIMIKDDGPGIPESELEHVFEPFYRGDRSRSRDTGGVGLGLAVTKDIITAHHGKIQLSNLQPCGLLVRITFNEKTL